MTDSKYSCREAEQGYGLYKRQDYAAAESALLKAVERHPWDFLSWRRLTYAVFFLNRPESEVRKLGLRTLRASDADAMRFFETHGRARALDLSQGDRPFDPLRPERNIISFSLWGDRDLYCRRAIDNVQAASYVFPEWTCRFYCARDVPKDITHSLRRYGAQVLFVDGGLRNAGIGSFEGLFWRFMASDDEKIDRFLCRDCDTVLSVQDRVAVDAWIASEKPFHVMRDHVIHVELILAGMRGGVAGVLPKIYGQLLEPGFLLSSNPRGADQDFLRLMVWPLIRDHALVHDSYYHPEFGDNFPPHGRLVRPNHLGGS